jgi:hypothetical protein
MENESYWRRMSLRLELRESFCDESADCNLAVRGMNGASNVSSSELWFASAVDDIELRDDVRKFPV